MSTTTAKRIDANSLNLKEQVVSINRVTKVVKGGKNLSFSALVVVGDPGAKRGLRHRQSQEVPAAIKKGIEARKFAQDSRAGNHHSASGAGQFGSGRVLLKPAPAAGVIAGGPVRAVIQAVGIQRADENHWLATRTTW
jgi:small subunit ribosomal protein S5